MVCSWPATERMEHLNTSPASDQLVTGSVTGAPAGATLPARLVSRTSGPPSQPVYVTNMATSACTGPQYCLDTIRTYCARYD